MSTSGTGRERRRSRSRSRSRDRGERTARGGSRPTGGGGAATAPPDTRGRSPPRGRRFTEASGAGPRDRQRFQRNPPQQQRGASPVEHNAARGRRVVIQREQPPVDRAKTCPFLMRVFISKGKQRVHRTVSDYSNGRVPTETEVHLYTWKDATLKELAGLIQEVEPEARRPRAVVSFAFVYPNKTGSMVVRQVGSVASGRPHAADDRTLGGCSFHPGDFLDVSVSVAPAPRIGGRLRSDGIMRPDNATGLAERGVALRGRAFVRGGRADDNGRQPRDRALRDRPPRGGGGGWGNPGGRNRRPERPNDLLRR